jgi:hypothetical protein
MKRVLLSIAAIMLATSAIALERHGYIHTTPPVTPNPLPQGVPYFVSGVPSHVPLTLRFAIVDGQRVLFEPTSGNIVYYLRP